MQYLAPFLKPFITRWPIRLLQLAAMLVVAQSCGQSDASSLLGPTVSPLDSAIVQLTPQQVTLASGDSNQFVAVEITPDSGEVAADVVWTATGGSISATGLFTAGATPGTYQVMAQVRGRSRWGTAPVVVATPLLTSLSLSPATTSLVEGATQQFAVGATWSSGSTSAPAVTYSVTGGTITASGLYMAGSTPGTFRVIATQQGGTKADTSIVNIAAPAVVLVEMVLAPAAVTLAPGGVGQFSVTGTWSDGSVTAPAVSYAATGGTITAGGVYTAGTTPGTYRVIASQQGGNKADTSAVTITAPAATLTKLTISPKTVSLAANGTQQFAVSGAWSDGSVTVPAATYTATGGTISATGAYTAGTAAGTFVVIATQQGGAKADTAAVTVTVAPPTLTKLTISPKTVSLAPNGTQQFAVAGAWSDGSATAPSATYSATGGTITAGGVYTAGATAGTYAVIATQQGGTKADTAAVTVTVAPPTLTKLTISPKTVSLAPSAVQLFSVSGSWSDGSVTVPAVTYNATGGTITAGGSYTAGATAGTFRVIAVQVGGTKADTAVVTVLPLAPTVTKLNLTPDTVIVPLGGTAQFAVTALWSDGSSSSPIVSYSATGGGITASGLFTAGGVVGSYRVIATYQSGNTSDTSAVKIVGQLLPAACQQAAYTRLVNVSTSAQLHSALANALVGDLIVMADGTYSALSNGEFRIRSISGTPTNRITLCGSPNAVIDAGSLTDTDGLNVQGANYWTFTGFTVTDALRGFYAEGSSNDLITGLVVHGTGQEAIHVRAFSKSDVIQGNTIYDTGLATALYGVGIYIGTSNGQWCTFTACAVDASDSTLIDGNTIGPNVRAESMVLQDGSTGGEVRNNIMNGAGMEMSGGTWPADWITVQGNGYNIHNNTGTSTPAYGFWVVLHAAGWANNNTFSANTANLGGAEWGFNITSGTTGNIVRCNNTVSNATGGLANVTCQP